MEKNKKEYELRPKASFELTGWKANMFLFSIMAIGGLIGSAITIAVKKK